MTEESPRNNRKELTGFVRAKTGDKSIKVVYVYKTPHPLYKRKYVVKQLSMFMMKKMNRWSEIRLKLLPLGL